MGKIYKALKSADEQCRKVNDRVLRPTLPKQVAVSSGKASARTRKNSYRDLKNKLLTRNIGGTIKTILFINTYNGYESTDPAFKFSALLAEDSGIKVLFMDLNLWNLNLQEVFRINYNLGLSDLFINEGKMASRIEKIGPKNLYTMRLGSGHSGFLELFEPGNNQFLNQIRKKFDYIILKSPTTVSFQECRILCSKVDSVVLVLKQGTNAAHRILTNKNSIEQSADKLLGGIINMSRYDRHQFVKVASVIVAICLILTFGSLMRNGSIRSTSTTKEVSIRSEKSIPPTRVKIAENATVRNDNEHDKVLVTKINTGLVVAREQNYESSIEVNPPIDTAEEKSSTSPEVVPLKAAEPIPETEVALNEMNEIQGEKERVVVVQKGETLFRIIYDNYGTYNDKIESLVFRENPKIKSSSQIFTGQSIKLPEINQLD